MHITQLVTLGTGLLSASILVAAQQQANGTTGSNGPQVQLTNANDFCLFLPPHPGLEVAVNEDDGIPFCMNATTIQGSQAFPTGFITTAHYQQTESYTQITGFFDSTKYNLSSTDGGGQYDSHANHKPTGASCQNFPYFVSLIEPSNNRFCIRCCQNTDDCKTGISQYGCARVVTPGNYDNNNAFDDVPPSTANESGSSGAPTASASASSSSSGAPTDSALASSGTGTGDESGSSGAPTASVSTSSGTGTGDVTTEQDNHTNQQLPNTSYNSVLDEFDTMSSSQDGTPSSSSTSNNGTDVKTVEDEVKYIQSQLQNPQVDLNSLKTQFSTFATNLSNQFPEVADKIKQLETIVSNYQTSEQWQHLATVFQQKNPSASGVPPSGAVSSN